MLRVATGGDGQHTGRANGQVTGLRLDDNGGFAEFREGFSARRLRTRTPEQRGPTDNCTDTATDSTDLLRDRDGFMPNEPGILLVGTAAREASWSMPSVRSFIYFRLVASRLSSRVRNRSVESVEVSVLLSVFGRCAAVPLCSFPEFPEEPDFFAVSLRGFRVLRG